MAISQLVNSPNQSAMAANRANLSTATAVTPYESNQVGTVSSATNNPMSDFNHVNFSSGFSNTGLSDPNVLGALVSLLTTLFQQIQSAGGLGGQAMNGNAGGNMNGNMGDTMNDNAGCCG